MSFAMDREIHEVLQCRFRDLEIEIALILSLPVSNVLKYIETPLPPSNKTERCAGYSYGMAEEARNPTINVVLNP